MISVYQAKDHRWRDSYNPLRGLSMPLPNGSDIKFVNGGGGRPPFLEHIDWVLQRDIDKPLLEAFFPGPPPLAYFEFSPVASDQTRQVVQDAVDLSKAGLKMDAEEVAEKTGYRVEAAAK